MEIEVALTIDDYAAPDRLLQSTQPNLMKSAKRLGRIGFAVAILTGACVIVGGLAAQIAIATLTLLAGLVVGAALSFLVMIRWLGDVSGRLARFQQSLVDLPENRWLFAMQRIVIGPEGVAVIASASQMHHQWTIVCRIATTSDHALLFISSNSAVILPRRAFRDQAHFEQFVGYANLCKQGRATDMLAKILARNPPRDSKGIWDPESSY